LQKRQKLSEEGSKIMFIIAGLGNPDKKYEHTRHNVGFDVIDALAEKYHIDMKEKKHRALCGSGWISGQKVLLLKPQTYMNLSGESIKEALNFYKLDPESELLVVYDDISLAPGRIRVRAKGSAGGHNGIKNIIAMTGTQSFARIKVGVGEKPEGWDLADYVLGRFSTEDRKLVEEAFDDAIRAAERILEDDLSGAMNEFNGKK
jgi:PTH1 family peptidyl-tRNA hydrolase